MISFCTDLIRRLDSSESRIMPSMLPYSRRLTYAPISAIDRICTMTTSSTSGNCSS